MAKSITVSVPHDLPPAEVKRRLERAIADARVKHGDLLKDARETWTSDSQMDFTVHTMGQTITGSARIEPTHVHLTVALPLLFAMFASSLKPRIEAEGQKLLGS
ncbi:MAG TPA: polyhydroxyalkanoic acid system family protein [Terriglobia bacterium]|nr:polyhydroxyalkanoic acid system family protein [Terriglobia bacterium]